jgi:transposase-like protein
MEKPRKGSKGGRLTIYDDSFKTAVARDYLDGNLSQLQVAQKHGIVLKTMYHFMRWYRKHRPDGTEEPQSSSVPLPAPDQLVKELAAARLKITALELLLSNAEREMGVDILKKPGTKPSAK